MKDIAAQVTSWFEGARLPLHVAPRLPLVTSRLPAINVALFVLICPEAEDPCTWLIIKDSSRAPSSYHHHAQGKVKCRCSEISFVLGWMCSTAIGSFPEDQYWPKSKVRPLRDMFKDDPFVCHIPHQTAASPNWPLSQLCSYRTNLQYSTLQSHHLNGFLDLSNCMPARKLPMGFLLSVKSRTVIKSPQWFAGTQFASSCSR